MDGAKEINNSLAENLEKKKLELLRQIVEKHDTDAKDQDDMILQRFLRARDLNVDKAAVLLLKYLRWRRTFIPKGFIAESEIPNEIAKQKMFVQGMDKKGRPIVVVLGARHTCYRELDEFKRFLVYSFDKICSRMPPGQERFVVIGDLEGYGYTNCDIRGFLAAIEIMQDYYPERLGRVYVIHAPYLFGTAWKIVSPFIDKNTKRKIVFVENEHLSEILLEDMDEGQLPQRYGGMLPLIPIHQS